MLEILRRDIYISIHVPREGDDCSENRVLGVVCYFNPRPP